MQADLAGRRADLSAARAFSNYCCVVAWIGIVSGGGHRLLYRMASVHVAGILAVRLLLN
jgi:hypothetical protein